MVDECVVAVFPHVSKAEYAIQQLASSGLPANQFSLVASGLKDRPDLVKELELSDDSLHDAAVAAELGSVIGLLSGLAVMVVSGLGAVFLAGPLAGAVMGGITGGFIGAMAGWGVHEHKLKHYEQLLAAGNVLVFAHGNPMELARAYRQLQETNASEVHLYSKSDDEATEPAG